MPHAHTRFSFLIWSDPGVFVELTARPQATQPLGWRLLPQQRRRRHCSTLLCSAPAPHCSNAPPRDGGASQISNVIFFQRPVLGEAKGRYGGRVLSADRARRNFEEQRRMSSHRTRLSSNGWGRGCGGRKSDQKMAQRLAPNPINAGAKVCGRQWQR